MKKALVILILVTFAAFLFSNALAIERVPKNDTQASKEQKEEEKPAPVSEKKESAPAEKQVTKPEPVTGQEQPREGEVRKPQKERDEGISRILRDSKKGLKEQGRDKYDYFIDRNGNGIDDRLEQQGKAEKKPEERKVPPEEKKAQTEKRERRGR
jgi:hypothetical protein